MNRIPLVLTVIGFVLLATGIVIVFANPLDTNGSYGPIRSYGIIVHPDEEMDSTISNSGIYVDATGFIPIVAGVGLLSIAFLGRIRKREKKNS